MRRGCAAIGRAFRLRAVGSSHGFAFVPLWGPFAGRQGLSSSRAWQRLEAARRVCGMTWHERRHVGVARCPLASWCILWGVFLVCALVGPRSLGGNRASHRHTLLWIGGPLGPPTDTKGCLWEARFPAWCTVWKYCCYHWSLALPMNVALLRGRTPTGNNLAHFPATCILRVSWTVFFSHVASGGRHRCTPGMTCASDGSAWPAADGRPAGPRHKAASERRTLA